MSNADPAWRRRFQELLSSLPAAPSAAEQRIIEATLWRILVEQAARDHGRDLVITTDVLRLLQRGETSAAFAELLRTTSPASCTPARQRECGLDARVCLALDYMQAHLSDPDLNLDRVARHVHLSKWYFDRLLMRFNGAGFRGTLAMMRVTRARELLETTLLEIKEIAARVGYTYANELTRHFRRFLGTTPLAIRRRSNAR